jgi:hypothetical protein
MCPYYRNTLAKLIITVDSVAYIDACPSFGSETTIYRQTAINF